MSRVRIARPGVWFGTVWGLIRGLFHPRLVQRPARAGASTLPPVTAAAPPRAGAGLWAAEEALPTTARDTLALARTGNRIGAIYLWQLQTGGSFHAARAAVAGLHSAGGSPS